MTPALRETSELESRTPAEWGMPVKFSSWRPGQAHAVEDIIDAPTRFIASNVPTGGGKSVMYNLSETLQGNRFCVLTSTKGLQSQLADPVTGDFIDSGMVDIRGKGNYDCVDYHGLTCDEAGPCCGAKERGECPYKQANDAACIAPSVVTNYACWLHRNKAMRTCSGAFTRVDKTEEPLPFDTLVLDEGHDAVEELSKFLAFQLLDEDIGSPKYINRSVPPSTTTIEGWKEFAKAVVTYVGEEVQATEQAISVGAKLSHTELREHSRRKRIHSNLRILSTCNTEMWVVEPFRDGYQFDPVWPGAYSSALFRDIKRVIITSATIRRKTMYLLGLKDDDFTFYEYPSTFSVNDAPIIYIPTAKLTYKSTLEDLRAVYNRIDQIIEPRLDRKGLIHTVSFKRAEDVLANTRHAKIMLANTQGWVKKKVSTAEAVEQFKAARPPSALVSPSVSTGYDFPGPLCEYNIIMKVPFPDSRSAVMKERLKRDPEYGHYVAAQDIVQACGRGNRFPGDRCQNFIVDDSIKWFTWKYKHLFPGYFHRFYRKSDTVPPPLRKI